MYTIEKNIPFQNTRNGDKVGLVSKMNVGDSFLITDEDDIHLARQKAASYTTAGRRLNMKLTARTTEEGVRVWRIK